MHDFSVKYGTGKNHSFRAASYFASNISLLSFLKCAVCEIKLWVFISKIRLELYLDLFLNTYMLICIKTGICNRFCVFSANKQ